MMATKHVDRPKRNAVECGNLNNVKRCGSTMSELTDSETKRGPSGMGKKLVGLAVSLVVLAASTAVFGQSANNTVINNLGDVVSRPMPGSGHDYIKGLVETVNPANGQLSIKIDLPVPADRGLTLPYAITYNSGELYNVSSSIVGCGGLGSPVCDSPGGPGSTNRSWMGWSDTFPYVTYSTALALLPPYNANCWISGSYNFYDPTGASHMLGLAGISDVQNGSGSGAQAEDPSACAGATYNNTDCFSQQEIGAGAEGCQGGPTYQPYSVGGDDEVIALSDYCTGLYPAGGPTPPMDCVNGTPAFTVTDSNGTTYSFPPGMTPQGSGSCGGGPFIVYPTQIEDRNGNILQDNMVTSGSSQIMQVTDTSGRILFSPWCGGGNGFYVGNLYFTTTWTTTQPNFSEQPNVDYAQIDPPPSSYNVFCSATFAIAPSNPMTVLRALTLPNGQQYGFKYDSTYGLVNEIDYPDGGWVKYTWGLADEKNELGSFAGKFTQNESIPPVVGACNYIYKAPVVKTRTVGYSQGSAPALTQSFSPYNTSWPTAGSQAPNAQCVTYANDNVCWSTKQTTVTTTDNVINKTSTTTYNYTPVFQPPQPNSIGQAPAELPVEQQVVYSDWGGSPLEMVSKQWIDQNEITAEQTYLYNGTPQTTFTSYSYLGGNNQDLVNFDSPAYAFGFPGQLLEKKQFDYYNLSSPPSWPPTPPPLASRITNYSYYTFTTPSGAKIDKPSQVVVTDGNGEWYAETDAFYDTQAASTVSGGNLPQGTYDPYYASHLSLPRGNPTMVVNCISQGPNCPGPTTTYAFDETGQEKSMTDPCGHPPCGDMPPGNHTTTYSYADNYTTLSSNGLNTSYTYNANTNALLTQIVDPMGHTQEFAYDFNNAQLTSATDENSQTTNYVYNDSLNRPTSINYPDGGQIEFHYYDPLYTINNEHPNPPNPTVTTCTLMSGTLGAACSSTSPPTGWKASVAVRDGLDHVIETELVSDPQGTDYQSFVFDGEGHTYQASNPYRSTSDSTYGITTSYFDALGRPTKVQHPDSTSELWSYSGNATTFTDEDTNQWTRTTDGLGRLTEVQEPNGVSAAASMATIYQYDPLNNLLKVTQNGISGATARIRTFTYDSLSQLVCASNPENSSASCPTNASSSYTTGTTGYSYDANGNLLAKTDARAITTSYFYDPLNRLTGKTYSDGLTPLACYQYDLSSVTNGIGRLSNEWTQKATSGSCSASYPPSSGYLTATLIQAYDPMGRLQGENQYTPWGAVNGTSRPMNYTYDFAGNLTSSTAGAVPPSMAVSPLTPIPCTTSAQFSATMLMFINCYDAAGHLSSVTSNAGTGTTSLFTASTTQGYEPWGALWNAIYGGNGSGGSYAVSLGRGYDNRLRVTSETDLNSGLTPSTSGSATVTITGAEQTQ